MLRRHIKTKQPSNKLDFKKIGPFEILEKIKDINFRLKLPKESRIHLIFHASLLEPAPSTTTMATNIEIELEHELDEYNVETILDSRVSRKVIEYLIK